MGVSTTHRINLSMWILIYSFSDTYYVWAACVYLSVNVFSTKVLTGDTIFYVSLWRRDCHFTWSAWSPKPSEGLTVCNAKAVPSFLRYIKVLLRRKFLFLFPSFFNINLLYMFKIIQIAKNWNDTCVRGLEISH